MSETLWVAVLTLVGTLAGTFGGILTSSKLTGWRLDKIEADLKEYHTDKTEIMSRIYKLEEHNAVIDEQIKVCNHRLSDLEGQ